MIILEADAVTYGIYDSRALAMGGTGVASASSEHAMFYNPALYSVYDDFKERKKQSRLFFPIIAVEVTEATRDFYRLQDDDFDAALPDAVDRFNADPSVENAQLVADLAGDFEDVLVDIGNEDMTMDAYLALSIGVPDRRQGGGFFIRSRLVGGGLVSTNDQDLNLLGDYVEALTFITSNGAEGEPHPELFDVAGDLLDPINDITSSVRAIGALITEVGLSASREFQFWGWPVALGAAPKLVYASAFEYVERVTAGSLRAGSNRESERNLNLDLGMVTEIGDHYRLALAVKDVYPKDYATGLNSEVRIRPRSRLGLSYYNTRVQLAMDVDLLENEPAGVEQPLQELGLGAHWQALPYLQLRGGYRVDLLGHREGILSGGFGLRFTGALVDLAYAKGSDTEAVALQVGIAF